jgi:hypothetical protein
MNHHWGDQLDRGQSSRATQSLAEADLAKLRSAWHTDRDLGREIKVMTDTIKSRLASFHEYQPTLAPFGIVQALGGRK